MFAFQFQKVSETVRFLDCVPSKFENPKNMTAVLFPNCSHMFQIFKPNGFEFASFDSKQFLTQDTWRCRSFNARVYGFIQRKWGNTNAGNEHKHNMPRKEKRHVGKKHQASNITNKPSRSTWTQEETKIESG